MKRVRNYLWLVRFWRLRWQFYAPRQVYGMLTSTLVIGGSVVEHFQLGYVCAACLETHDISLPSVL